MSLFQSEGMTFELTWSNWYLRCSTSFSSAAVLRADSIDDDVHDAELGNASAASFSHCSSRKGQNFRNSSNVSKSSIILLLVSKCYISWQQRVTKKKKTSIVLSSNFSVSIVLPLPAAAEVPSSSSLARSLVQPGSADSASTASNGS